MTSRLQRFADAYVDNQRALEYFLPLYREALEKLAHNTVEDLMDEAVKYQTLSVLSKVRFIAEISVKFSKHPVFPDGLVNQDEMVRKCASFAMSIMAREILRIEKELEVDRAGQLA